MRNVDIKIDENGIMTITVDTNLRVGDSKSGKTILIGSTDGNEKIQTRGGVIHIGVNVYTYPDNRR